MSSRNLIVNADDFGQSSGVNAGIVQAHEHGIVTSTSLMVRFPAAADAARYARAHRGLSVGLHVDLGEWRFSRGEWVPVYEVVDVEDAGAVQAELARQLARFSELTGREPSHLDSHQHVHRREPLRSLVIAAGERLEVPVREQSSRVQYRGDFYGQDEDGTPAPERITIDALIALVRSTGPGFTELGCHPGTGNDLDTMYREERSIELQALCDERVRAAIESEGIVATSFAALPR